MVEDRESAIVSNLGLVHSLANRFKGRGIEYDDIYQAGCIGLIKAVDNFDEGRGFAFSTYAVPVILGEIKRLFRDGGSIKVSRSLKEKSIKVQYKREEFINKNSREPTVTELASLTGYDCAQLSEILCVMTPVRSLSLWFDEDEGESDIPIDESEKLFDRLSIDEATAKLNDTEKTILNNRFFLGKTQCETAKMLGISQVQVSRKEKALLLKLREYMK